MIRVLFLSAFVALIVCLGTVATPLGTACYANDPNLLTLPPNSPPVSYSIGFGQLPYQTLTVNGATSDQSWAAATGIMPSLVVWTIDPASLPIGLSCANISISSSTIVLTSCFAGSYENYHMRGCAWGVSAPNGYSGSCEYPAFGTPTTGTGSTTCIQTGTYQTQINVNVTPSFNVSLVDPVPDLVSRNSVKTSTQLQSLLTKGRLVKGVTADGVTQLVIRIDTQTANEQFTVTLQNDQSIPSLSANEDGALDFPGGTSFSQNRITVTAGGLDSNGMAHAFAVYRAPVDFARPTPSGFKSGYCNGMASVTSDTTNQDAAASTSSCKTRITPPYVDYHHP